MWLRGYSVSSTERTSEANRGCIIVSSRKQAKRDGRTTSYRSKQSVCENEGTRAGECERTSVKTRNEIRRWKKKLNELLSFNEFLQTDVN